MDGWYYFYGIRKGDVGIFPFDMDHKGSSKFFFEGLVDTGPSPFESHKGDNVLSHDRVALVEGIIEGYEIYISKIIDRDIYEQAVRTDTTLAYPYLQTQLYRDQGIPKVKGMDKFL